MSDQYSHADGSRECRPVVGHGSALESVHSDKHQALYLAAHALYTAGRWTCDRACDAAALWTALRDALGLPPGTATALGMGTRLATREEAQQIFSGMEREVIRDLIGSYANELKELRDRVQGLLEANNREVERRRGGEALLRGAAKLFRTYEAHHETKVVGLVGLKRDAVKDKIIRNALAATEIESFLAGENA